MCIYIYPYVCITQVIITRTSGLKHGKHVSSSPTGFKSKNPHCLFGSQPGGSGYTNLKATDGLTHRQIPAEFDPRSEDIPILTI